MQGNEQQNKAIIWNTGPALILAGPGSGKTFTTVERVRYLIEVHKVDPSQILVITFTRAAAKEMRDRFYSRMEGELLPVTFGTFHAVFFQILKISSHYASGSILSEKEKREYLRTAFAAMKEELPQQEDWEAGLLSEIGCLKNKGKMEENFQSLYLERPKFKQLFCIFQKLLFDMGKLDLDDFAAAVKHLFLKNPDILKEWQEHFRYILVDEFQDINAAQYEVMKLLAGEEQNLFVVGDDDQAIYGFRGSDPVIMQQFLTDFPGAAQIPLSVNYRSRPGIVETAGILVGKNKKRLPKRIAAGKKAERKDAAGKLRKSAASADQGVFGWQPFSKDESVQIGAFADRKQQVREIVGKIAELRGCSEGQGMQAPSIAAIFRTNTDCAMLAEGLGAARIPYVMKEKLTSPYSHMVCRDLLAYLSFAKKEKSRAHFFRIMNKPCRYISRQMVTDTEVSLERLLQKYGQQEYLRKNITKLKNDISRIAGMDLYAAVNYVRRAAGYDGWMKSEWKEAAYREGMEMADFFQESVREFETVEALEEHIRRYEESLLEAQKNQEQGPADAVHLITMHGSKGLEFDVVFLPDCNEGVVPHKKSMRGAEVEEERRMFYVGMTRAKELLYISWVAGSGLDVGFPSRFLGDFGYRTPYRGEPSVIHAKL